MKATQEQIEQIVSVLTNEEQQLLKDVIKFGFWGDSEEEFLNEEGEVEYFEMEGYCTNDAKRGGNFTGRKISVLFRSIYRKLCPKNNRIGKAISHCSDWWGDGTGDMLFIRDIYVEAFRQWARMK